MIGPLLMMGACASGEFDPTSITGLAAWYDASDTDTITINAGTEVQQWDDKSGNARHLTRGSSFGPDTGVRSQNGLNVLDYDGNQRLSRSAFWRGLGDSTVFVVFVRDDPGSTPFIAGVVAETTPDGGDNDEYGMRTSGSAASHSLQFLSFDDGVGTEFLISGTNADDVWALWSGTDTTTAAELFKDGTSVASDASYTRVFSPSTTFSVGSYSPGTSRGLIGAVAEVLIYDTDLGASDRQAVEDYLIEKWGL